MVSITKKQFLISLNSIISDIKYFPANDSELAFHIPQGLICGSIFTGNTLEVGKNIGLLSILDNKIDIKDLNEFKSDILPLKNVRFIPNNDHTSIFHYDEYILFVDSIIGITRYPKDSSKIIVETKMK